MEHKPGSHFFVMIVEHHGVFVFSHDFPFLDSVAYPEQVQQVLAEFQQRNPLVDLRDDAYSVSVYLNH